MNRTALFFAALSVTASTVTYLFGRDVTLLFGALLCLFAGVLFVYCKRRGLGYRAVAVLLMGAVFCTFLNVYSYAKVDRIQRLEGQRHTVVCRVVEEPIRKDGYIECEVMTDGTNGFDGGAFGSVKLKLYINNDSKAANASEGDILTADVAFKPIDESARKSFWAEQVFLRATVDSASVIGHKETLYTYCIDLRRSIRNGIDAHTDGDSSAVLKGLLLGDISEMSNELYSDFKMCGVLHVTAVSGMHIGAFCMMVTSVLGLFMKRRKAAAFAFIPLVLVVLLAGATPSALRAGVMCGIALLSDCLLKKTDSLNSLGVAVVVLLIYNPFYILNLGFQLSAGASAGVILAAPYGTTLCNKLAKTRVRFINTVISSIIRGFSASIGATLLTMPFQVISFGFVSVVAPLAGTLICSAAVYTMAVTVVALIMYCIPYLDTLAVLPFWMAELLVTYIRVVVNLLARLRFSYVPFGTNVAILCIGLSIALIAVWIILDRPCGNRGASLLVAVLLVTGLLTDSISSRNVVEIAVLNTGNGLCTVVSSGDKCFIIGCGDDPSDRYELRNHLSHRGVTEVEALFLPNNSKACFGGYADILEEVNPADVIVPENFGNSEVFSGGITVAADESEFTLLNGKVSARLIKCDFGGVIEINCCQKRIVVGNSSYNVTEKLAEDVDCVITSRVIPKADGIGLALVSADRELELDGVDRTVTTAGRNISVKLKPNKGMTVYAGQG